MSEFDAYFKWLGIPPEDQPPDHYRLLGIPAFTSDADVIASAIDRQVAHVRTFALGPHSDDSQRILNELAAARVCLESPEKKAAYNNSLRARVPETKQVVGTSEASPTEPASINGESNYEVLSSRRTSRRRRSRTHDRRVIGIIGAAIGLLVVIGLVVFMWPETPSPPSEQDTAGQQGQPVAGTDNTQPQQVKHQLVGRLSLTIKQDSPSASFCSGSLSRDGTRIVSGTFGKMLKVWDAETGQNTLTLTGHSSSVRDVSVSPDGTRILSGDLDGTLRIWDAKTGSEIRTLRGQAGQVLSVGYSPDGKRIVCGGYEKTVRVWDAATGEELLVLEGHTGYVLSASFSHDGKRIVSGGVDQMVKIWDSETGQERITLSEHGGPVHSAMFSPDRKRVVSSGEQRELTVWDAETGKEILRLAGHRGTVHKANFSPDGKWIVSGGSDTTVRVWDATTGEELLALRGHSYRVLNVIFGPTGKRIFSFGRKTVKVWDLDTVPLTTPSTNTKTPNQPRIGAAVVAVERMVPVASDVENGQKQYVTTLRPLWVSAHRFTTDGRGYSAVGGITVNGNPSPFGMALHPRLESKTGYVAYKIPSGYQLLAGAVAVDDSRRDQASTLTFRVDGGGQVLWKSPGISEKGKPVGFCVRLAEVSEIVLTVSCSSSNSATAVWLDPVLLKSSEGRTLEEIAEIQRKRWLKAAR
jgi:WD40 repeat protein